METFMEDLFEFRAGVGVMGGLRGLDGMRHTKR